MYNYQTADPILYRRLKEYARKNRNNLTQEESTVWELLRADALGYTFKRQHIIGPFIADFVCLAKNLVIELDGGYHSVPEQQISDEQRTNWLNAHGFEVIRFTNEEVWEDLDKVLERIEYYLNR